MIVAIDGPAGAGKSTVARGVAETLGFAYLDSGAFYRCVALASLEDPTRTPAEHAGTLEVSLGESILLGGRDVTHAIRSPTVSAQASVVAADPVVREALVASQRDLLASGDCAGFSAAVQPRLNTYAEAGVTWITVEPASAGI